MDGQGGRRGAALEVVLHEHIERVRELAVERTAYLLLDPPREARRAPEQQLGQVVGAPDPAALATCKRQVHHRAELLQEPTSFRTDSARRLGDRGHRTQ